MEVNKGDGDCTGGQKCTWIFFLKIDLTLGRVAHPYNPSTWEAKEGRSLRI